MISKGSVGGAPFAGGAIADGTFIIEADGNGQTGTQARVEAVRRVVDAGSSLSRSGALVAAIARRISRANVAVSIEAAGSAVRRRVPSGEAPAVPTSSLAPRRRTVAAGSSRFDAILSIVTAWKSLQPTDAQRRIYILKRRTLAVVGERRVVRLAASARVIRVPPEKDL